MQNTYHELTKHSYLSVRENSKPLDWSKQPSVYKVYENYPKIPLDLNNKTHKFLYMLGGITAKKSYPGVEYYLRTVPSAGALYPVEIYFQSRGVEGFVDGIYHFDVANSAIRLLYKIEDDEGVEFFYPDRRVVEGFLFLYSGVYYRSSWKYKDRAFRYLLLDAGHALGALEVAAFWFEHAYYILFDFDKLALNERFGFENREFFLSSAVVGKRGKRRVKRFDMRLSYVEATYSFEKNPVIEEAYIKTVWLRGCTKSFFYPRINFVRSRLEEAIFHRRSIREFTGTPIKKEEFEFILGYMSDKVPSDCDERVDIYYVVNRVEGVKKGLYKNGELLVEGDYSKKAGYLCLEQALGSESAVTFFLTGSAKSNYQPLYQKAGLIGHRVYIAGEYLQIGVSGIGAYYDDEVREFLNTEDMVLYAIAIGR